MSQAKSESDVMGIPVKRVKRWSDSFQAYEEVDQYDLTKPRYSSRWHQPFGNNAAEAVVVVTATAYCPRCELRVSCKSSGVYKDASKRTLSHFHDGLPRRRGRNSWTIEKHEAVMSISSEEWTRQFDMKGEG